MFSTPLICSSSGVATVSAITLGLAPGNCARTTTVGGTTSGYSEIGNWKTEIRPARKMTTEITPAKIGRSMKKRERFMGGPGMVSAAFAAALTQLVLVGGLSWPVRRRQCLG